MANKTLHSLQFPGLSDVYVVPEDAQEFSSESTYAVGEFVTYQGVLYKCTTAVTTAGSWTGATNWSATDVGTELQDTYGPSRPNFSVNNPVMDGTASPGSATTYARSDHIHPSDTSKLDIPENSGVAGQVLTKTANGSIWQTQGSGGEIIAAASNSYSVTLYANSWTTQEQLIATPTGAQITSTSDGVLGLSPNATTAQVEAFQLAKIIVISQSASGVVVKALGIVPTINLPCELMIFMKADYYTKDYIDTYMAPLDTPTFIGVPKAPTAAAGTNTTQIATTAFVEDAKQTRLPKYGMGKNLLDNWYFLNPVNQRGKSSYSGVGQYTIDRWRIVNCTLTIESDGIKITKTNTEMLRQPMSSAFWKSLLGQTVTLSVLGSDGLASATFTMPSTLGSWDTTGPYLNGLGIDIIGNASADGACYFRFFSSDPNGTEWKLYAIKFELGSEQTLCHNEGTDANPVWVLNEVPNYEEELFKCSTSTADSTDDYANKPNVNATIRYYTSQAVAAGSNTTIMRIPAGSATDPNITTDTVVLDCTFAAPANITSNITWTSYAGYINFVGSCSASTTANVTLGRKGN